MATAQCSRHPEEILRFFCVPCATPICRDCKLTHHEGHRTTDVDLLASDLCTKLAVEIEEVGKTLRAATAMKDKLQKSLDSMDRSVETTKSYLDKRVQAVVEWAQTYRLALDKRIREMRQQTRGKMEEGLESIQQQVTYLTQLTSSMTQAVDGQAVSPHHVAKVYADYLQYHKGLFPKALEFDDMASGGNLLEMTLTESKPDECQRAIERYLGFPMMSRQLSTHPPSSRWSFSTRVTHNAPTTTPSSLTSPSSMLIVVDILPANDRSVSVLYRHGESSSSFTLVHYSPDGVKRAERNFEGGGGEFILAPMTPTSNPFSSLPLIPHLAVFSASSESWQKQEWFSASVQAKGDSATPLSTTTATATTTTSSTTTTTTTTSKPHTVLYLKCGANRSAVCEVTCPLPGQSSPKASVLLTLDFSDAIAVTASADYLYMAVLRKCQAIHVYQRCTGESFSALSTWDVTGQLLGLRVRSVCWAKLRHQDVLIVAESVYSALLLLDPVRGCALISFLTLPRPHPTCLRADVPTGTLWLGCEGGEVLEGRLISLEEEDVHMIEDPDGYLLPSEDCYFNILALRQTSSKSDPPAPARPPRKPVPELPPKKKSNSGSVTSHKNDQLAMPLSPPPPIEPEALEAFGPPSSLGGSLYELLHYKPKEAGNGDDVTYQYQKIDLPVPPAPSSPSCMQATEPPQLSPGPRHPGSYENIRLSEIRDGEPGQDRQRVKFSQTLPTDADASTNEPGKETCKSADTAPANSRLRHEREDWMPPMPPPKPKSKGPVVLKVSPKPSQGKVQGTSEKPDIKEKPVHPEKQATSDVPEVPPKQGNLTMLPVQLTKRKGLPPL